MSYLLHSDYKTKEWEEIRMNPNKYFIPINNEQIYEKFQVIDPFYIEGAIEIRYYGQEVMGIKYWDLIDQLWSYMLNLVGEYLQKGMSECYFPDMPVKLSFTSKSNGLIQFQIAENKWVLPEKEFINCLIEGSLFFFEKANELIENVDYTSDIKRINQMKLSIVKYFDY